MRGIQGFRGAPCPRGRGCWLGNDPMGSKGTSIFAEIFLVVWILFLLILNYFLYVKKCIDGGAISWVGVALERGRLSSLDTPPPKTSAGS